MTVDKVNPLKDQDVEETEDEETWQEYFLGAFVRYWYILGCLAADVFSSLEVLRHQEWGLRHALVAIMLAAFLVIEIWAYRKLWGKDGIWNFEEEDQL